MPTYEYRCKECGEHLEVVQAFTDDPLTECPACGGELRKVFGNIGITFKGSGFYKTDSRTKSGSGASKDASKDSKAGSSDAGDSKPSESKPDITSAKSDSASSSSGSSDAKSA